MSKSKLLVGMAILGMAVIGFAGIAFALTDTCAVKVTVTGDTAVDVIDADAPYVFGAVAPNDTSVSTRSVTVKNTSSGLQEDWKLNAANSSPDGWTLAASPTGDTFTLQAQFSTAQPSNADGSWTDDTLTDTAVDCSATAFGNGTAGEAGIDVPANAGAGSEREVWFRIKTPTSLTKGSGAEQTVTVTVTAIQG